MNGKGDKDRTSDIRRYQDNYEKIFGSNLDNTTTGRPRYKQDVPRRKVGTSRKYN